MASTLSACPRDESALDEGLSEGHGAPAASGIRAPTAQRFLEFAVLLHGAGLVLSLIHTVSLPSLLVLASGLAVALLALRVAGPTPAARTPLQSHSADLSPAKGGSGASPSPLPFMGERIVLGSAASQIAGLARAAARLGAMPAARAHPLGELMARVSHELRTPLNAVIGFSDIMRSELLGPVGHPRYQEYVSHIGDCGRELLKSAEDTLAITCLLDHDPSASIVTGVDLKLMVEEAWAFHCGPSASHGLSIECNVADDIEVLIERAPMRQILINLFAEAVRRADARGTLGVVASVTGDLVQVEVFLRGQPGEPRVGQASLAVCLARALLELNGAALVEVDDPHSTWRTVTVLRCVAQCDFFTGLPDGVPARQQPVETLCEAAHA